MAAPAVAASPDVRRWLFDAVRKYRQVEHFRAAYGASVFHLHLDAPEEVLRARYERRLAAEGEPVEGAYDRTIAHDNELQSRALIHIADAVVGSHPGDGAQLLADALAKIRRKLPNAL